MNANGLLPRRRQTIKCRARAESGPQDRPDVSTRRGPAASAGTCSQDAVSTSADPFPGLAAAEHSAEGAALNPQRIRPLHRDRGVVGAAAVRIMNLTGPFP